MARITIEDCLKEIDNAFDICALAGKRAKAVSYTHLTLPTICSV